MDFNRDGVRERKETQKRSVQAPEDGAMTTVTGTFFKNSRGQKWLIFSYLSLSFVLTHLRFKPSLFYSQAFRVMENNFLNNK